MKEKANEYYIQVGARIKEKRLEKGLSLGDLAEAVGYSNRSSITRIEAGKQKISTIMAERFARALGTTVPYLLGMESTDTKPELTEPVITADSLTMPVILEALKNMDNIDLKTIAFYADALLKEKGEDN